MPLTAAERDRNIGELYKEVSEEFVEFVAPLITMLGSSAASIDAKVSERVKFLTSRLRHLYQLCEHEFGSECDDLIVGIGRLRAAAEAQAYAKERRNDWSEKAAWQEVADMVKRHRQLEIDRQTAVAPMPADYPMPLAWVLSLLWSEWFEAPTLDECVRACGRKIGTLNGWQSGTDRAHCYGDVKSNGAMAEAKADASRGHASWRYRYRMLPSLPAQACPPV